MKLPLIIALTVCLLGSPVSAQQAKKRVTLGSSSSSSPPVLESVASSTQKKYWIGKVSPALRRKAEASVKQMKSAERTKLLKLLNSGNTRSLQKIRGIGKVRASYIVKGRPYRTLDAVVDITGIGEKTFANIIKHAKKL